MALSVKERDLQERVDLLSVQVAEGTPRDDETGARTLSPVSVLAVVATVALSALVLLRAAVNPGSNTTQVRSIALRGLQEVPPIICPFDLTVDFNVPQVASRPQETLCVAPPTMYEMFYKANMCAPEPFAQAITDYTCEDFNGGPTPGKKVYISAVGSNDRQLYSGSHENLQDFYIWNLFNPLPETTTLEIYEDADRSKLLQRVSFPSTCEGAPNGDVLANTFGAVQITGFTNKQQGDVTVQASSSEPVEIPPIKATFTLSSNDATAGSYTMSMWHFTTNYTQPATIEIPMQGTPIASTGEPLQTSMDITGVNLMNLPQTLETIVSVKATSDETMEECEVLMSDIFTITDDLPNESFNN